MKVFVCFWMLCVYESRMKSWMMKLFCYSLKCARPNVLFGWIISDCWRTSEDERNIWDGIAELEGGNRGWMNRYRILQAVIVLRRWIQIVVQSFILAQRSIHSSKVGAFQHTLITEFQIPYSAPLTSGLHYVETLAPAAVCDTHIYT